MDPPPAPQDVKNPLTGPPKAKNPLTVPPITKNPLTGPLKEAPIPSSEESIPKLAASEQIDCSKHQFEVPIKMVKGPDDMQPWVRSQAYKDITGFISCINEAVKNKKLRDPFPVSKRVESLVAVLNQMNSWIDEIPPVEQPQRFGNKAFRDFFDKVKQNAESLLKGALDESLHNSITEISVYLVESIGNYTRIDYGTGHELSFVAFMCCLFKVGALIEEDLIASTFVLFHKYIQFVRKLQQTYRMEPAGSQGVWSLDDFQFVPFIWGSAQFLGQRRILPKSFVNPDIYENFDKDYMFLGCIKHINTVKTGPFAEHSNQLWGISGVAEWTKVNSGLIKMYKAEVLGKFPVIQHFMFGSLLPFEQPK